MWNDLPALMIFGAIMLGAASELAAADENLFEQDRLTGDWGGVRKQWQDVGVDLGVNDTAETLSNLTGGVRQLTISRQLRNSISCSNGWT